jgi:chorismate synthase
MGSSIGKLFKLTTYGESHGLMIGGIVEGCPSGLKIDIESIQKDLNRRKPGQSKITTSRNESDQVQITSGVFEGVTTGTPIGFFIPNTNAKSKDYSNIKDVYRPSHADYTFDKKYGVRDYRGGGRSSARETACRVVAGAIAKQILSHYDIDLLAYVCGVGNLKITNSSEDLVQLRKLSCENIVKCPDNEMAQKMVDYIGDLKSKGDSVGGQIFCLIKGVPPGLGDPVFDKLHADLGKAILSINAVKGFEYGSGFGGTSMLGSDHNDVFESDASGKVTTKTNHSGGIQGGISNGQTIYFNVAFKPVATILTNQKSINNDNKNIELTAKGRHDPCVVPRAVPIVEAMAALVIVDHLLLNRTVKL